MWSKEKKKNSINHLESCKSCNLWIKLEMVHIWLIIRQVTTKNICHKPICGALWCFETCQQHYICWHCKEAF